jgi:hypothetical protein
LELGAGKATTATAHKVARRFYRLMKHGEAHVQQSQAEYEAARHLGLQLLDASTGELLGA